jgi:flagellar capping protein FliD
MTIDGNIITGDGTFNDDGDPVYPENGLQLSVDLSVDGAYTAAVRVKQGFTGAIEDAIDRMLKTTTGSIQIAQESADGSIDGLQDRIEDEEYRLEKREARLVAKFAQLERTLTLLQNQMVGLGLGF